MYILKQIRMELGLTGKQFAKILKIHPATLYHYEEGLRRPKDDFAHQFIVILKRRYNRDVTLEQLKPQK